MDISIGSFECSLRQVRFTAEKVTRCGQVGYETFPRGRPVTFKLVNRYG